MFARLSPGVSLEHIVFEHLSSAGQQGAMCPRSFCFCRLINGMIPRSLGFLYGGWCSKVGTFILQLLESEIHDREIHLGILIWIARI